MLMMMVILAVKVMTNVKNYSDSNHDYKNVNDGYDDNNDGVVKHVC